MSQGGDAPQARSPSLMLALLGGSIGSTFFGSQNERPVAELSETHHGLLVRPSLELKKRISVVWFAVQMLSV